MGLAVIHTHLERVKNYIMKTKNYIKTKKSLRGHPFLLFGGGRGGENVLTNIKYNSIDKINYVIFLKRRLMHGFKFTESINGMVNHFRRILRDRGKTRRRGNSSNKSDL